MQKLSKIMRTVTTGPLFYLRFTVTITERERALLNLRNRLLKYSICFWKMALTLTFNFIQQGKKLWRAKLYHFSVKWKMSNWGKTFLKISSRMGSISIDLRTFLIDKSNHGDADTSTTPSLKWLHGYPLEMILRKERLIMSSSRQPLKVESMLTQASLHGISNKIMMKIFIKVRWNH